MRSVWLAMLGLLIVATGIAGIVWTLSSRAPASRTAPSTEYSLGARIFIYGVGEDGPIPRTAIGPGMMGGGCARCHGTGGTGRYVGMMGGFEAPDIRYSTLTSPHEDHDEEGWSDRDIRRAIVDGVEPDGEELDPVMPRWSLSDAEFRALIDYLKELDGR
ncbi:MAG: c-type cytochrome [Anaerosomatales bacterium]|nr:c-type cytochrome [Anaerosomatales bacterium]